jgi:hypothetical protein
MFIGWMNFSNARLKKKELFYWSDNELYAKKVIVYQKKIDNIKKNAA